MSSLGLNPNKTNRLVRAMAKERQLGQVLPKDQGGHDTFGRTRERWQHRYDTVPRRTPRNGSRGLKMRPLASLHLELSFPGTAQGRQGTLCQRRAPVVAACAPTFERPCERRVGGRTNVRRLRCLGRFCHSGSRSRVWSSAARRDGRSRAPYLALPSTWFAAL